MLTDFGLARAADDASMTQSGTLAGTPEYMSPEQARGSDIDSRSDLCSLGSVLYYMCTGHAPFRASTTMGILHRITTDSQRSLCSVNEEVPQWLDAIVGKLLEKEPDDRFQTADEVSALLSEWLAHLQQPETAPKPLAIQRPTPAKTSDSSNGRHLRRWLMAAGGGFALLAGFVIAIELDKGTLTIKCDADNVPVRIMKADKVHQKLRIDRGVSSARIAAGDYVVELDAEVEGLAVKDGIIELSSGGAAIASIVESVESSQDEDKAIAQLASEAQGVSPGAIRESAAHARRAGITGPVRVEFLKGTDVFVVRGKKADVERVMSMIDGLKDQRSVTENSARNSTQHQAASSVQNADPLASSGYVPVAQNETPQVRRPANVEVSIDNLATVSRALHQYAETFGRFPGTSITARTVVSSRATFVDDKRTPPYSWRVAILPFIGHSDLYNRYRFEESWDSPHNLELADEIPDVYRILGSHPDSTSTAIMGFAGSSTGLGTGDGVSPRAFEDGISNTVLVVLAASSVPWTKPVDLDFDARTPLAPKSLRDGSQVNGDDTLYIAFADNTVGMMQPVDWNELKKLITRNGGEQNRGVTRVPKYSKRADWPALWDRSRAPEANAVEGRLDVGGFGS